MKYANKLKTKYAVIIGEDEVNSNTIVLKNMYEGIQFTLNREEIVKEIECTQMVMRFILLIMVGLGRDMVK